MPLTIDRRPGALYFPVITSLLLILALAAFSDNLFTDIHQPSNSDPQMVVHGLFGAAWAALFAAQAWLVNLKRVAWHRQLGQMAFGAAAGLILSTLYLFYSRFKGFAVMEPEVVANRLLLPVFMVCVTLAWRNRGRPDWHKRLSLIGTLALQEPVLARLYDPFLSWMISADIDKVLDEALFLTYLFGSWLALIGSLWLHDRARLGRVHPVTLWGSAAIVAANALAYAIGA